MPIIKTSLTAAARRKVDDALDITELFENPAARIDIAVAELHGVHGQYKNDVSDKIYLILEGEGTLVVGHESVNVGPMDVVFIPPGETHGIAGNLKFLVIMTPPFDPEKDRRVGPMP
jgi:mannose-6-phosphate isomerase-like protein (cupin superfamily)